MSNKSRLQANNINIQALIDKANSLPDAGSGGGGSSGGTVTVLVSGNPEPGTYIYYIDGDFNLRTELLQKEKTYNIFDKSLFLMQSSMNVTGATRITRVGMGALYRAGTQNGHGGGSVN